MRLKRPAHRTFIATASLCVALAAAQAPAWGRHPDLDLDALDDDTLDALIQAELDDHELVKCGIGNPNAQKSEQQMFDIIMCALGDEGDDESEQGLDFDDLEDEMREAGTTVAKVVWAALELADARASGPASPADRRTAAALADAPPASLVAGLGVDGELLAQIKDGRINPGKASVPFVKAGLEAGVRAVVRPPR